MNLLNFTIASTIVFMFLALIWKKGDWLNVTLKLLFIILTFCGAYLIFHA
jgi:hypothetical protein